MALEQLSPPESVQTALLESFKESGGPDEKSIRYAHPLYYIPAESLLTDAPVLFKVAGWQFLARDVNGKAFAGEVSNTRALDYETAIVQGSAVEEAFKASEEVKGLPPAQSNVSYQLRTLRIPALRIEAFWLKAGPFDDGVGDADIVYPYLTFQEKLKKAVLGMSDFLEIARGLAEIEARADSAPLRKSGR
jgi:hypothetical protein